MTEQERRNNHMEQYAAPPVMKLWQLPLFVTGLIVGYVLLGLIARRLNLPGGTEGLVLLLAVAAYFMRRSGSFRYVLDGDTVYITRFMGFWERMVLRTPVKNLRPAGQQDAGVHVEYAHFGERGKGVRMAAAEAGRVRVLEIDAASALPQWVEMAQREPDYVAKDEMDEHHV